MNKVYTRINWENYPSENTAVNETNLNKMDFALDELDTRVVQHETTKANVASLNNLIDDWVIDETTGVITIHKVSGEQIIFDLNIEKIPVGFSMTDDGILIMTTDDGKGFTANIGSMIPILTFNDSEQIAVAVSGEGVNKTYKFTIKTGSIGEDKLQPNFLADCRLYAGNAENSATLAEEYAQQAKESAESIIIDDSISETSENPVQNKVIAKKFVGVDERLNAVESDVETAQSTANSKMSGDSKLLLSIYSNGGLHTLTDKISNYKFLYLYLGDSSVTFGNFILPADMASDYVSDTNAIAFGVDTTRLGERKYGICTFKSDTQLYVQVSTGLSMTIYGIK